MNTLEIIEEMRANPALAEELRAVVLSRELLALPERMASVDDRLARLLEVSERHEATLERLEATVERHEAILTRLLEVSERHEATLERLEATLERHEATLERLEATVERLEAIVERHQATLERHEATLERLVGYVAQLRGGYFETKWEKNAHAYLGSRGFRRLKLVDKGTLAALLDDACDAGTLSDADHDEVLLADSVHAAVSRADATPVYIVSEVAARVHADDFERALRRAKLLQAATGVPCVAAVAGGSVDRVVAEEDHGRAIVVQPAEWEDAAE